MKADRKNIRSTKVSKSSEKLNSQHERYYPRGKVWTLETRIICLFTTLYEYPFQLTQKTEARNDF